MDQIEEGIEEILYRMFNYFHFSITTPINSREKECYSYQKPRNEIGNQFYSYFQGVGLLFLTEVCLDEFDLYSSSPVWLRPICSQLSQLFYALSLRPTMAQGAFWVNTNLRLTSRVAEARERCLPKI